MDFLFPGFLVGLLAVGVPIVIHLLELRRPQRVRFTNIGFIREVELVANRQRKVQQWLVLTARVLGLVALVLMFCQPFWAGQQHKDSITSRVRVLVDGSVSMQAQGDGGVQLLEEAKEQAGTLVKKYPGAVRFGLAGARTSYTAEGVQKKLDEMRPLAQLTGGELITSAAEATDGGPTYVFSDFQKSAVSPAQLKDLGRGRTVLVPLVAQQQGNIYVDSVWFDDAFVRARTNLALHLRMRNGGSAAAAQCPVKVFVGQQQAAALQVTVAAGAQQDVTLQVQAPDNQTALCRVETGDAPVTFDNAFYFVLQPAAVIRVLEIGDEPLTRAAYVNEPVFSYSFATPGGLDYGTLRTADLVLLREVAQPSAGLREALTAAAKRGASVVVVPRSEAAGHEAYQALFRALGAGEVQWESPTANAELRELAMPGKQEPFFRDVFGAQQRAVAMPRAAAVLRWARTGSDILRFKDGESYLAEFGSGKGKVFVFAAPFAAKYSDVASHALFVPVLYRLAMQSYRREQLPAYWLTQAAVTLELPGTASASNADQTPLRLVQGGAELIPGQRVLGGQVRLELPPGMSGPGFYQLKNGSKVLTTLAFNADNRESELAAYSVAELRALVGPNVQVLDGGPVGAGLAQLRANETGQPLWRYCLGLALACLLAEALLLRFGGRKRGLALG